MSVSDRASTKCVGVGRVGRAETLEHLGEGRHDPGQQRDRDEQREAQHGERVGQCPAHPRALRGAALAILDQAREQGGELAGGFADRDQLPEHRIELARVMPHGFR